MPRDYVRRNSRRPSKKRSYKSRKSSKKFPWFSFLLLILFIVILGLIFLFMSGKLHLKLPRKTTQTVVKAQEGKSGAIVENAKPVSFDKNKKAEQQQVKFDFYTMLPKMKVEVANTADASSQNQADVKYYVLQLASFKGVDKAKTFQTQLKQKGFSTKRLLMIRHGHQWYRIQIGPIHTLAKAKQIREQLRNKDIDSVLLTFKM